MNLSYQNELGKFLKRKRGLLGLLTKRKRHDRFNEDNIERLIKECTTLRNRARKLEHKVSAMEKQLAATEATANCRIDSMKERKTLDEKLDDFTMDLWIDHECFLKTLAYLYAIVTRVVYDTLVLIALVLIIRILLNYE